MAGTEGKRRTSVDEDARKERTFRTTEEISVAFPQKIKARTEIHQSQRVLSQMPQQDVHTMFLAALCKIPQVWILINCKE